MRKLTFFSFVFLILIGCQNDPATSGVALTPEGLKSEIDTWKMKVLSKEPLSKDSVMTLIDKHELFADSFSKDTLAPILLYDAAEFAKKIKEPGLAIKLWGQLQRDYPGHEKAPYALFLQGFTFENDIKDEFNAKNYYRHVMNRYPRHPLARQAQLALDNMEKSPEELIRKFKEKNQQ